tara:strand:- start:314 stop:580 length:267 start_codon:yes stop_codon:yes gene_type:complete
MEEYVMLKADGLDEAIIGVGSRCGQDDILIYDYEKCVDIFMKREGWTHEEAEEWMDYNVVGAWMGEGTPMFLYKIHDWDEVVGNETAH